MLNRPKPTESKLLKRRDWQRKKQREKLLRRQQEKLVKKLKQQLQNEIEWYGLNRT